MAELENEFFESAFLIFFLLYLNVGHFAFAFAFFALSQWKKAAHSYEVSFISGIWMVSSESWKRLHPNYLICTQLYIIIFYVSNKHWVINDDINKCHDSAPMTKNPKSKTLNFWFGIQKQFPMIKFGLANYPTHHLTQK